MGNRGGRKSEKQMKRKMKMKMKNGGR